MGRGKNIVINGFPTTCWTVGFFSCYNLLLVCFDRADTQYLENYRKPFEWKVGAEKILYFYGMEGHGCGQALCLMISQVCVMRWCSISNGVVMYLHLKQQSCVYAESAALKGTWLFPFSRKWYFHFPMHLTCHFGVPLILADTLVLEWGREASDFHRE